MVCSGTVRFRIAIVVIGTEYDGLSVSLGTWKLGIPPDAFLHLFARLERNYFLGFDIHAFAGARISRLAGLAHFDFENTEVSKLNPSHLDERIDNGIEGLLNDVLGLKLGQPDPFGYLLDDLFLGHG
jgi:hypothetical protein